MGNSEILTSLSQFYARKRVLVTGHTGFKGSWLTRWLAASGSNVVGIALAPEGERSLFRDARLHEICDSRIQDVRDPVSVLDIARGSSPDIVFHLAAQSLVRKSYEDPIGTYSTNVMGTVNVLEAIRSVDTVRAVVVVTSDKCYENTGGTDGFSEDDALGGYDPYSSSKACQELVSSAYRRSFMLHSGPVLATARAGNVIGGGDWASDRLIPDLMRAAFRDEVVTIRHPAATRPWQHVLDPLRGYLMLAQACFEKGSDFGTAWNFGPPGDDVLTVRQIVGMVAEEWPGLEMRFADNPPSGMQEATCLKLDSRRARERLGWESHFTAPESVKATVAWYRDYRNEPGKAGELMDRQVDSYRNLPVDSKGDDHA